MMAYTDGSTEPGSDSPSGFGIALHEVGRPAGAKDLAGPCRASGNNYLAECVGILGAVQLTPAQADLTVYTDSAAAIWAVKSAAALPNGKRLRMGARPVVHGLARLIQARTGRTTLRHIRSHTGLPDENSRGNEREPRARSRLFSGAMANMWSETFGLRSRGFSCEGGLPIGAGSRTKAALHERWVPAY